MKKLFATACLMALCVPAFAADKEPPHPSCGKTADECQKVVEDLTNKLAQQTLTAQAERQQRINAQAAQGDQITQAWVAQQTAVAAGSKK